MEVLSIRKTHKYVGTYRYLDEWEDIGIIELMGQRVLSVDYEDPCEYTVTEKIVRVTCDGVQPKEKIEQALRDTYTSHGCAHEYDCCGCWSTHVTGVKEQFPSASGLARIYTVTTSSSRNY